MRCRRRKWHRVGKAIDTSDLFEQFLDLADIEYARGQYAAAFRALAPLLDTDQPGGLQCLVGRHQARQVAESLLQALDAVDAEPDIAVPAEFRQRLDVGRMPVVELDAGDGDGAQRQRAPVGENGEVVGVGDAYAQAKRCIEIIGTALAGAGAGLGDVVRTRMFVTDIGQWEAIGRAHGEAFGDILPATAMVEVSQLIDPDMLVEIEADAVIHDPDGTIRM